MSALPPLPGRSAAELDDALRLCEEIAARDQSNLWLVSQFLQDRVRYEAFVAMYAVMRVVDDRVDSLPGPGVIGAEERARVLSELDRWEERIGRALAGRTGGKDTPSDPLDTALAAAAASFPAPAALWTNFLRAMRFDVDNDRIDTRARFLEYAEGATAAPTTLYVLILTTVRGPEGRYTLPASPDGFDLAGCGRNLGLFAYLAHILRDVTKDLRLGERGRIYLPLEDLSAAGLSEKDYEAIVSGRTGEARWDRLVSLVMERARSFETAGAALARTRFPAMDPDCRFILSLIIRTYGQLLDRIEADPRCMLAGDIPLAAAEAAAAAAAETGVGAGRLSPIEADSRFRAYAGLMDEGRYFEAHEVLEAFWLVAPESQRDQLQGLVQVAVACEHRRRGNDPGARRVLERAKSRMARSPGNPAAWLPLLEAAGDYIEGVTSSLGFRFLA